LKIAGSGELAVSGSLPDPDGHKEAGTQQRKDRMTPFETRLGELDELLADGTRFGTIEDWIEDQPIDGDSKAALWLMAWSEQPRAQRREMVAPGPDRLR
jgi:hypothetical protein